MLEKRLFVLLGMPRAGTTFLYHNLQKHPRIFVPFRRKTNYYAVHYQKDRDWYRSHFEGAKDDQVILETDTLSFINTSSYERFKASATEERIILVLRDPATWALSLYRQIASFTFKMPSFKEYVAEGYTLVEDATDIPFHFKPGDLQRKVEDIRATFGEKLMIINFDLIKRDPLKFLGAFESFMEIEPHFSEDNFTNERINSGNKKSNKWVNSLLRKQWLIGLLRAFIPQRLVVWIRNRFDKASVNKKEVGDVSWNEEDLAFAQDYYAQDAAYIQSLFAEKDVLVAHKVLEE